LDEDKVRKGMAEFVEQFVKWCRERDEIVRRLQRDLPIKREEIPRAIEMLIEEVEKSELSPGIKIALLSCIEVVFQKEKPYIA